MTPPKRTITELEVLYRKHPNRRDIFVEGASDKVFVTFFLRHNHLSGIKVYTIDTVSIPDDLINNIVEKSNNREFVVYLATRYTDCSHAMKHNITGIIDADFSHLRHDIINLESLIYTDYACMEMYFYQSTILGRIVSYHLPDVNWPPDDIIDCLSNILQELFLYRFANDELQWRMSWLDKLPGIDIDSGNIRLDKDLFVDRLLNKNGRMSQKSEFFQKVDDLRPTLRENPRYQINGHDFTKLLSKLFTSLRAKSDLVIKKNIYSTLIHTTDPNLYQSEDLFQRIYHLAS